MKIASVKSALSKFESITSDWAKLAFCKLHLDKFVRLHLMAFRNAFERSFPEKSIPLKSLCAKMWGILASVNCLLLDSRKTLNQVDFSVSVIFMSLFFSIYQFSQNES